MKVVKITKYYGVWTCCECNGLAGVDPCFRVVYDEQLHDGTDYTWACTECLNRIIDKSELVLLLLQMKTEAT